METTLHSLYLGFSVALLPANAWYAFLGCVVGTLAVTGGAGSATARQVQRKMLGGFHAVFVQHVRLQAGPDLPDFRTHIRA